MEVPSHLTTRTASIGLRADGIVLVRIAAGVVQSLEDATANLDAAARTTGGAHRPILVDITDAEPLSPEVRRLYSGRRLIDAFSALALLVHASPVGRMLGNVYFRVAKPGIPIQLFQEEAKAVAWLRGKDERRS